MFQIFVVLVSVPIVRTVKRYEREKSYIKVFFNRFIERKIVLEHRPESVVYQ